MISQPMGFNMVTVLTRLLCWRIGDLEIVNRLVKLVVVMVAQKFVKIAPVLHLIENAVLVAIAQNCIKPRSQAPMARRKVVTG